MDQRRGARCPAGAGQDHERSATARCGPCAAAEDSGHRLATLRRHARQEHRRDRRHPCAQDSKRRQTQQARGDSACLKLTAPGLGFADSGTPLASTCLRVAVYYRVSYPADAARHKATPVAVAERNRRIAREHAWASMKSTTRSTRIRWPATIAKSYRDRSRRWPTPKHISPSRTGVRWSAASSILTDRSQMNSLKLGSFKLQDNRCGGHGAIECWCDSRDAADSE